MKRDRLAIARAVTGGVAAAMRGRAVLAVAAIAFGVAIGYAVELINDAAARELTAGAALLSGDADLEVRGPRAGFNESLYAVVSTDEDVAAASPVVAIDAGLRDRSETLPILGVDVFRVIAVNPAIVAVGRDRLDALRSDTLFPSNAAARWLGVDTGDTVAVQSGLRVIPLRVAGRAGREGSTRYAVMDIAAAQQAFDRVGRLTRIDLRLRPGADIGTVQRRLQALSPPGVHVAPPGSDAAATLRFSRAYRVNLDVLSLVALFTGALLVYATQTLSVVRRGPYFALLRTLGLSRRRLVGWVIAESALLGAIGAAIGLGVGYAIASAALRAFGPDLGAGFFYARAVVPTVAPSSLLLFGALGILATIGGSALPALEAARAAPAAALKAGGADIAGRLGSTAGWVMLAAGCAAAFLPPASDLPLFGYVAIALLLIGGIIVIPSLAHAMIRSLPLSRIPAIALALAHLRATRGRFPAMLGPIVASIALMMSMAIMVASFRQSLDDWLSVMLPADLYLRTASDSAWFSADDQRAISGIPGVSRVEFLRATSVVIDPARPAVTVLARDIDRRNAGARLALVGKSLSPPRDGPPPAWISEAVADARSLAVGQVLALPLADRDVTFFVAGVWRDYARPQGAIVVERPRYRELTGDDSVNEAAVWLAAGARAPAVRDAIVAGAARGARIGVATPADLRRLSLATFDRTFAVTYALEAAAVLIGLVGLSAGFVAQTLARTREFGMLRHIGVTRRQIGAMLAFEGTLVAALGVISGLALAFAISLILIEVVNRQSFHWGMDVHVPWTMLALLSCALLALATLTAHFSARGAAGGNAVRAVREDW